ncbi:MAG: dienelactone hydrolase family protein [Bryobacteraceae bacterium]
MTAARCLLLLAPFALRADVFADQYRQLVDYYTREIAAAGPHLAVENLGAAEPRLRNPTRTLLAVWPDARIEELSLEVEPGHRAHALLLTPANPNGRLTIALGPLDRTAEAWAGLAPGSEPAPWLASLIAQRNSVCLPIPIPRTGDLKGRRKLHRLAFVTGRTLTGLEVTELRGLAGYLRPSELSLYGEADGAWTAAWAARVDSRFRTLTVAHATPPEVDQTVFANRGAPESKLPALALAPANIRAGQPLGKTQIEERARRHENALHEFLRARIARAAANRHARHPLAASTPQAAVPKLLADLLALMGPIPTSAPGINARVTGIARTDRFTAHEVLVDVLPGVELYGHLLVPHGAKQAPAVVAQHGLGGKPHDLTLQGPEPNAAYHGFAARLAEHGYVVFAPYVNVPIPQAQLINNLVRMANSIGRMRTNVEVAKLRRAIDFLQSLPEVDPARIGYYGLSYGGYSAIWMAPLEPRIKATVVSGHFNDWTSKITNESQSTSYLQHPDEDFFNWNVLNRLTHTELIAAFWPRPVMVEFARDDGTTFPAWHERAWAEVDAFAKAWRAEDRFVRDRFIGIHEIHGIAAFDFLDRWLRPERPSSRAFEHWGAVEHVVDANPLSWVRGTFRVGTADPFFRGLVFDASGPIDIRYEVLPGTRLDAARLYRYELRPKGGFPVTLRGPKPLGGARYPGDFAATYRPVTPSGPAPAP